MRAKRGRLGRPCLVITCFFQWVFTARGSFWIVGSASQSFTLSGDPAVSLASLLLTEGQLWQPNKAIFSNVYWNLRSSDIPQRLSHNVSGGFVLNAIFWRKSLMLPKELLLRTPRASASGAIWAICPTPAFGHYHAAHRNMPQFRALLAPSQWGRINFCPLPLAYLPRVSQMVYCSQSLQLWD